MYHPIPDSFGPGYRCQWMADMDCGLDYGYKSSHDSMGGATCQAGTCWVATF